MTTTKPQREEECVRQLSARVCPPREQAAIETQERVEQEGTANESYDEASLHLAPLQHAARLGLKNHREKKLSPPPCSAAAVCLPPPPPLWPFAPPNVCLWWRVVGPLLPRTSRAGQRESLKCHLPRRHSRCVLRRQRRNSCFVSQPLRRGGGPLGR